MTDADVIPIEKRLVNDKWFAYNALKPVCEYLEADDLVRLAQVCKLWNWIIWYDRNLMFSRTFATCEFHFAGLASKFGPEIRNIEIDGIARTTTRSLTKELRKLPNVRRITLADCCLPKLTQIVEILSPDVEAIHIEQTHKEYPIPYSLDFVKKFTNLTYLGVMTFSDIIPESLAALKHLTKLTHLFVYDGCESFTFETLRDLKSLKCLHIGGDTSYFLNKGPDYIKSILKDHENLRQIKLDITQDCNYTFFQGLNHIPHLTELELNGEILNKRVGNKFINGLSQCTNIKVLTLEMDPGPEFSPLNTVFEHATRNNILHKAVLKLKNSLTHLYWLVPNYYIKWAREVCGPDQSLLFPRYQNKPPKTLKDVKVTHVKAFEKKLNQQMPKTKVLVLVQHYNYRYCSGCRRNKRQNN